MVIKEEIMKLKKLTILSIEFVALCLFSWQGCKIAETVYETIQEKLFSNSGHADNASEAFRHWDEEDPAEVPTGCAKCHSLGGFIDFAENGVVGSARQTRWSFAA